MANHVCRCTVCAPPTYPAILGSERRQADNHFAIRWDDEWIANVEIDGLPYGECWECVAGEDGWAAIHRYDETGRVHYCGCGSWRLCTEIVRGCVQVMRTFPVPVTTGDAG